MRGRRFLILLPILTTLLGACENGRPDPVASIAAVLSEPSASVRKAHIKRQIAAVCPNPLSDDDLEWAAQFIEGNRSKGAVWIAGRLSKMDAETRKCRGM